jgi:uncharacterized protein (TIGR02145 family)
MRWFNFLSYSFFSILLACGPEEIQELNNDKYQGVFGKEFKPHQIISFNPGPLDGSLIIFEGEFGGIPIEAGKTDKNEIVFIVPDLSTGVYQLRLEIGGENRIWDVSIEDQAIEVRNLADFWSDYFAGSATIYEGLADLPRLDYYVKEAKEWSSFFETQFSGLSQMEKDELIYIIYRNGFESFIPFSFEVSGEFENCLEENFAVYVRNSFEEGWYQKELKKKMVYLPSSKVNDAFLAFMADLIWRHSAVAEILAPRVFACPILKEVILQSKFGFVGAEPIIFNSGDSMGFKLTGVYSTLSSLDGRSDEVGLAYKVNYFDIAKNQRVTDEEMISSLIQLKNLDLPIFNRTTHFSLPIDVQEVNKPLIDFKAEIGPLSNPDITLAQQSQNEDSLFLTFEKKKAERQDFQFSIALEHSGFSVEKNLEGTMPENSELILDLSFDRGTAFLQIISGQAPFDIFWSNGVNDETQVKFDAGKHSVQVKNGNGFEKIIEFMIPEFGTVEDREGNEYETVKIGDRWWMAENLRNTTRKDGRPVLERADWPSWNPSMPPEFDYASFSYYLNEPENEIRYGMLYNIHAILGCLCPEGWEVPFVKDFVEMGEELGGAYLAGPKLKRRGSWNEPAFYSTNEAGFNAKPGGMKFQSYSYKDEGIFTGWWARNEKVPNYLPNFIAYLNFGNNQLKTMSRDVFYFEGHYVRCIKKE